MTKPCEWCGTDTHPDMTVCQGCRRSYNLQREAMAKHAARELCPPKGPGYTATPEHTAWAKGWAHPEEGVTHSIDDDCPLSDVPGVCECPVHVDLPRSRNVTWMDAPSNAGHVAGVL